MDAGHRYNAACAAALRGEWPGPGRPSTRRGGSHAVAETGTLLAPSRPRGLEATCGQPDPIDSRLRDPDAPALASHPDLEGLRDNDALENLPEKERDKLRTFWAEVKAPLDQAKGR